ncbi:cyclase family protein [Fodinicola feengrottensis]|uniref:cyclase family protein n=1 Tax=Fodinicola feengrottensis TaxID=435914 RepID=UPI002442BF31|nr:cyclase family protein [Fodinicola feengrottensis]
MALVELNHVISAGMLTFPGLPGPEIGTHLSYQESHDHYPAGTEFVIHRVSMVGNTGTYVDSPAHRYRDGVDLENLPLSSLADLPTVVVRCRERAIEPAGLAPIKDIEGSAVLLHTGWDRHWGTPAYAQKTRHT